MSKYEASIREVIEIERDAVGAQLENLDMAVMDKIVDVLCSIKPEGRKVITAGCGTSGIAAEKIAHTLSVMEVPTFFLSPANSIHGGMGAIQKRDVVILITKGGNTPEILNYIPVCKKKGATIIGVTEREDSALAQNCDILLKVIIEKEPCPWNMIASGSILAVLSVFDAIAFTIMKETGFDKEQFFLTHPGGSAGEKLLLQRTKTSD